MSVSTNARRGAVEVLNVPRSSSYRLSPVTGIRSGSGDGEGLRTGVSVIIKAYNGERHVVAAVEHALRAVAKVGEVILADSSSTDRTIELASRYPIRIVTLENPQERRCGVGPQLGYQNSRGEFIYVVDGDMKMREGFLEEAIAYLNAHPEVAGVGGLIHEHNVGHMEYQMRADASATHLSAGVTGRLDGGGLYRAAAIEQVGYLSDRNLHRYEELELAARLRAAGWALVRIPVVAVDHFGHDVAPYKLLMRRWRTRYAFGIGELIRAGLGKPHAAISWRETRELRLYLAVVGWWLVLIAILAWPMPLPSKSAWLLAGIAAPLVAMIIRKRSVSRALYSMAAWCVNTAGMLRGGVVRPISPRTRIADRTVLDRVPTGSGGTSN